MNALVDMYSELNFEVLGFPCNQFGLQSPGKANHETLNILKYARPGAGFIPKFPVFAKVKVNGLDEHPFFTYLKNSLSFVNPVIGDIKKFYWSPIRVNDIRWNFEKFLIRADGGEPGLYSREYRGQGKGHPGCDASPSQDLHIKW
uniref:Glutathione peroxidase n=1 Tax=Paramormyrops kingsleyae TaxID=1676925 RepID=A0A3B3RZX5_9TELE